MNDGILSDRARTPPAKLLGYSLNKRSFNLHTLKMKRGATITRNCCPSTLLFLFFFCYFFLCFQFGYTPYRPTATHLLFANDANKRLGQSADNFICLLVALCVHCFVYSFANSYSMVFYAAAQPALVAQLRCFYTSFFTIESHLSLCETFYGIQVSILFVVKLAKW